MFTALALAASIALTVLEPVAAPPPAPAKGPHEIDLPVAGVTNSGDAGSSIVETVIDAPVKRVWEVFTTEEGFKALGSAHTKMDFRVGGLILSTYDPKGNLEDEHHIENEIIAFDPERMVSIRIHRPPPGFPFPNACKNTWSVITMEPVGPDHTRLRLAMLGFTPDKESQGMKDFFDRGNAYTLKHLRDTLGSAEARRKTDKAWALITSLVGDTWRGCTTLEGGQNVCARTLWNYGPNQKSVIFSIWLTDVPGASAHIHQVISPEAATGTIVYTAVDDTGSVMSGHVTLTSDDSVTMDWNSELPDGTKSHQFVTLTIPSPGTYTQRNYSSSTDLALAKPWVTMTYTHPGTGAVQPEASPKTDASPAAAPPRS